MIQFCSSLMFSMTTSSPVSGPIVRICRGCVRTSPSPHPDGSRSHQWPRQPSPYETHASLRLRVSFCSPGSLHPKIPKSKVPKIDESRGLFSQRPKTQHFQNLQTRFPVAPGDDLPHHRWRISAPGKSFSWNNVPCSFPRITNKNPVFFTGKATLKSSTSTIPAASLHLSLLFLYQARCVSTLTLIMLYICEALHPLPRKRLLHLIS